MPLHENKGLQGDRRPNAHRFRSRWLELGRRLREFRARYGLTQDEIAVVVAAADGSAVTQWETGVNVSDGMRRERVISLLEGRLWRELRTAVIDDGKRMPRRWDQGVRWYRRASRERPQRDTLGPVVQAILEELRLVDSRDWLHRHYLERDGEWARGRAAKEGLGDKAGTDVRRIEDAAYGLRWLELVQLARF